MPLHAPFSKSLKALLPAFFLACPLFADTGPFVGAVTTSDAHFLYRCDDGAKKLRLTVFDAASKPVAVSESTGVAADDFVAKFHVSGLKPDTAYTYGIDAVGGDKPGALAKPADGLRFRTALPPGKPGVVTAAFVSCANDSAEGVWERMGKLGVDRLFVCGDTPYIDNFDLKIIRAKHRHFLSTPFLSALVRNTPTVGTWDDHDFGANNGNGYTLKKTKETARRVFVEYRANDQFGDGKEGVYNKIDLGPVEVFVLDPRWFSQTAPSPVDPTQKTCFGAEQWKWILASLKASKAPFKVLAFGEIWQDKKTSSETDDMFTYWYERDALLDFIRAEKISGVTLLGGDIHVSRHLVHPDRVGYDLHDFISSPAHGSIIPSLDVPHPDLEWSSKEKHQFLTLTADTTATPAKLTARFYTAAGTVQREVVISLDDMVPREGSGLGRGLRAWWPFDADLKNKTFLGDRLDAESGPGATVVSDGGIRGGALELSGNGSYTFAPRNALDDNTAAYTLSLWCKAVSLPAHGGKDVAFLAESTLGRDLYKAPAPLAAGKKPPVSQVGDDFGRAISLALRADGSDATKVVLELTTNTIKPALNEKSAPMAIVQGPFVTRLDRSLFAGRWAQVSTTFDSKNLRVYLDGKLAATHKLPVPGPCSEFSGLVFGGDRAGAGSNFSGRLDEVALWSRALGGTEIAELYHGGEPRALPVAVTPAK